MRIIAGIICLFKISSSTSSDIVDLFSKDEIEAILLIHTGLNYEQYLRELNRTRTSATPESSDFLKAKELGFIF
jgi:hypothetical protein